MYDFVVKFCAAFINDQHNIFDSYIYSYYIYLFFCPCTNAKIAVVRKNLMRTMPVLHFCGYLDSGLSLCILVKK